MQFAIIIGAYKAGTTSLFEYLSEHPEIAPCSIKEPNFFGNNEKFLLGFEWYKSLWDFDESIHKIALEATMLYSWVPLIKNIPERIKTTGHEYKFIYILRDPIERIESHLTYALTKSNDNNYSKDSNYIHDHLIDVSNYYKQIKEYSSRFDQKDILIVDFEELKNDKINLLKKICKFLVISDYKFCINYKLYNKSEGRLIPHPIWFKLRKKNFITKIYRILPFKLRSILRDYFGHKVDQNIKLSSSQKKYVIEKLSKDFRKLKNEYAINIDRWGF